MIQYDRHKYQQREIKLYVQYIVHLYATTANWNYDIFIIILWADSGKSQGPHKGGCKHGPLLLAPFQKKKTSESVCAAGRPGPADPADPIQFVHKCSNVTNVCFDLILPDSGLAENHRFCHAGVGYRRIFP